MEGHKEKEGVALMDSFIEAHICKEIEEGPASCKTRRTIIIDKEA